MKPFWDCDLSRVIAKQKEDAQKKIDSMSNEEIMANDLSILAENIYQEFFIEPVEIFEEDFSKRDIKQGKVRRFIEPFLRGYEEKEYVDIDGVIATFYYPYSGDKILFQCRASTYSLSPYPEVFVDSSHISFRSERTLAEMQKPNAIEKLIVGFDHMVEEIKQGLAYANNDVRSFNSSLKDMAVKLLEEKRKKVESFFDIAKMLEVPVEKTAYAKAYIPIKRKIVPTAKQYESTDYYGIYDANYNDILTTIKHSLSTYERTPASYRTLQEEDLRNTLLATLNATYEGNATGETFRNKGKTDICIEWKNRAAFVAECKVWTGPKAVERAVNQLDGYLTWRDCKTALIYFVRRKDFMQTLEAAEKALRSIEYMRSVSAVDKNEFECLFTSKSNLGQTIKMRVMLFNLFCESAD